METASDVDSQNHRGEKESWSIENAVSDKLIQCSTDRAWDSTRFGKQTNPRDDCLSIGDSIFVNRIVIGDFLEGLAHRNALIV